MKVVCFLAIAFSTLCAAQKTVTYIDAFEPFRGPQAYEDRASGTIFYVESDGRHVAAISRDGRLLWVRDPFGDAHLSFYRTETPQIVYIGHGQLAGIQHVFGGAAALQKKWKEDGTVAIRFNSSQFGDINMRTGEFVMLGQD